MREQDQIFEKNPQSEENLQSEKNSKPKQPKPEEVLREYWVTAIKKSELETYWVNPERNWINRQSAITAGELVAFITIILIFGFTGILSPEITGGVALGVFLGESLIVCTTGRSLLSNLLTSPHIFSKPKPKKRIVKPKMKKSSIDATTNKPTNEPALSIEEKNPQAVATNKEEVSSIKEKNSQNVETNKEEVSSIEEKNSQAIETNKEEISPIEEKKSNENTSYTTFRTIFGIITKKISTENSKLNIQSKNSSNYGSNGETITTSPIKKTLQIPELKEDSLLDSVKYEKLEDNIPTNSEASNETSTTRCNIS